MQCYIYKSLKKDELYLYLAKKDDFSDLPDSLFNSFGPLEFVLELDLTESRQLAREDSSKVLESLNSKGFFVQLPPTRVTNPVMEKNQKLH